MANVEIYALSTCPFCRRAKKLLQEKQVNYTEYLVDGNEKLREEMIARGNDGKRSVPQIFINDQHIGGSDDLYQLESEGKLDQLLNQTLVRSH